MLKTYVLLQCLVHRQYDKSLEHVEIELKKCEDYQRKY